MPRGPHRTRRSTSRSTQPAPRRSGRASTQSATSASANLQPSRRPRRPRTPAADNVEPETAPPQSPTPSGQQFHTATTNPTPSTSAQIASTPVQPNLPGIYFNFVSGTYRVNSYYTAPTSLLAACHSPACIDELHTALLSAYTFAGIAMANLSYMA